MRKGLIGGIVLAMLACLGLVHGEVTAWFGGGSYDGFDTDRILGAADTPRIHNAFGASVYSETKAVLNGMLTATGGAPAKVAVFWGGTMAVPADWPTPTSSPAFARGGSMRSSDISISSRTQTVYVHAGRNGYYGEGGYRAVRTAPGD